MPVYQYQCEKCGLFDQLRERAEASSPISCPICGGDTRRIYSPPSLSKAGYSAPTLTLKQDRDANARAS